MDGIFFPDNDLFKYLHLNSSSAGSVVKIEQGNLLPRSNSQNARVYNTSFRFHATKRKDAPSSSKSRNDY